VSQGGAAGTSLTRFLEIAGSDQRQEGANE